jgi:4-hydroxy-4-methyl-2-oxoglutarate aldolase
MTLRRVLEELRDFDTALLANTIGYIDETPPHEWYMGGSIRSLTPSLEPTVGVAFTCELDSSTPVGERPADEYAEKGLGFYDQLEAMTSAGIPAVWVVKAVGSRPDHECVLGDGMAKELFAAGCVGAVTDGGARDIKGCLTVPFAVYARGTTIHHCPLRFRSFGQSITIAGITVRPGDVIHANSEGVIRIPPGCLDRLAERATAMRAFEHEAHRAFRRTDWSPAEKREFVNGLLIQYGFAAQTARAEP